MKITILKELVSVCINWKEEIDSMALQEEWGFFHKIRGIDKNRSFIRGNWIEKCRSDSGCIRAEVVIGELYLLNLGIDITINHRYIVILENGEYFIMNYEDAVVYFLEQLRKNKELK